MRLHILLLATLTSSGCSAPLLNGSVQSREQSPFYQIPGGTRLILNQPISIPPNRVRAYFQHGAQVVAVNRYEPYCSLEVLTLTPTRQTVVADTFAIVRSTRDRDLHANYENQLRVVSSHRTAALLRWDQEGQPSPVVYVTRLALSSDRQPSVYQMNCGHLQDYNAFGRYLSVAQIRDALGGYFSLALPENQPQ